MAEKNTIINVKTVLGYDELYPITKMTNVTGGGDPADLNTTATELVSAINEVKAIADSKQKAITTGADAPSGGDFGDIYIRTTS